MVKQLDESTEALHVAAMRGISAEIVVQKGCVLSRKSIYYLIDGVCGLIFISEDGNEYSYMYFKKYMLLNFLPTVAAHGVYTNITEKRFQRMQHRIVAKTKCTLLCTPGEVFLEHMKDNLLLNHLLVRSLTENWINLLTTSTGITSTPVCTRVCQLLEDNLPPQSPYTIPRYLTHTEIAAHLSMHTITVTKIFKALRDQNIITKAGHVYEVVDLSGLLALSGGKTVLSY